MAKVAVRRMGEALGVVSRWQEEHPYLFSFIVSLLLVSYILFSSPITDVVEGDTSQSDILQFLDIETIAPARAVPKDISVDDANADPDTSQVDRALGTADEEAVDTAFYPNIAPPRPVGRLKKLYPKSARDKGIEGTLNVELHIAANVKVVKVRVLRVKLSKELPLQQKTQIKKDFTRDAKRILLGHQFTPFIINGKKKPAKQDWLLRFRL